VIKADTVRQSIVSRPESDRLQSLSAVYWPDAGEASGRRASGWRATGRTGRSSGAVASLASTSTARRSSSPHTMPIEVVFETHELSGDNERGIATGELPGRLSAVGRCDAAEVGRWRPGRWRRGDGHHRGVHLGPAPRRRDGADHPGHQMSRIRSGPRPGSARLRTAQDHLDGVRRRCARGGSPV